METYSAEDAKKRYEKLPTEIRNLLYTPGMSFTVQQIGTKNKLHIDQIDILNTEIGQLMLGFIDPKEFPPILMEMLHLDRVQADAITQDVNEMLLAPIREAMKKNYETYAAENEPVLSDTLLNEKSVIMPSAAGAITPEPKPAISIPPKIVPPTTPAPIIPPAPAPKPADMHEAELMLSEPTVSMPKPAAPPVAAPVVPPVAPSSSAPATPAPAAPKAEPPKPAPYKADPYREPPE